MNKPAPSLPTVAGRWLFTSSPQQQALERNKAEKLSQYRRDYWQDYKKQKRRVFGTISKAEHAAWTALAKSNGRSLWGQIFTCACAYISGTHIASREILQTQNELLTEIRRVGNNINQAVRLGHIQAKRTGGLKAPENDEIGRTILNEFETLERRITQFETIIPHYTQSNKAACSHDH